MNEALRTDEDRNFRPRSAHEINQRVRRIEMGRLHLGVTPLSDREATGAAWGPGRKVRENAQTHAVAMGTLSQAQRIDLTGGGVEIRREGKPVESTALRDWSSLTAEQPIGAGLVTQEKMPDGKEKLNGVALAPKNGQVVHSDGISPTTATGHTKPAGEGPHGESAQSRAAAVALPGATGEAEIVTRKGRQRTPKPWLMSVLCRSAIHKGQWAFVVEGNCTQGRECGRCGSVHARTKHERLWVYTSEGSCLQVKNCLRCNISEGEGTNHQSWSGISGSRERCDRCGIVRDISYDD